MSKQTAVKWFAEQDTQLTIDFLEGRLTQIELAVKKMDCLQQAIKMEDNQNFEFWHAGINSTEEGGKSFDQYIKSKQ